MPPRISAQLLAIVEVDQASRVLCQQPGCGHTVYKAIHVVLDGSTMVLGSTCFAKRYGSLNALGKPSYGGGHGRKLTDEERALLVQNTQELLARFAATEAAERERIKARIQELQGRAFGSDSQIAALREQWRRAPLNGAAQAPGWGPAKPGPWPWMRPSTSMAYFKLSDGSGWVRVQRRDGQQMLAPMPVFEGWDEALPALVGSADQEHLAYHVPDIARAIAYLRKRTTKELVSGIWTEIQAAAQN